MVYVHIYPWIYPLAISFKLSMYIPTVYPCFYFGIYAAYPPLSIFVMLLIHVRCFVSIVFISDIHAVCHTYCWIFHLGFLARLFRKFFPIVHVLRINSLASMRSIKLAVRLSVFNFTPPSAAPTLLGPGPCQTRLLAHRSGTGFRRVGGSGSRPRASAGSYPNRSGTGFRHCRRRRPSPCLGQRRRWLWPPSLRRQVRVRPMA